MLNTAERETMAGRVIKTCKNQYGFIINDTGKQWFFHVKDCVPRQMPLVDTVVRFVPVTQIGGKNPRAIHVEAL